MTNKYLLLKSSEDTSYIMSKQSELVVCRITPGLLPAGYDQKMVDVLNDVREASHPVMAEHIAMPKKRGPKKKY